MRNPILVVSSVVLLCLAFGCQNKAERAELEKMKAIEAIEENNKAIARQLFEVLDAQNYNRLLELFAPTAVIHISQENLSAETVAQLAGSIYKAFPDGIHGIEDIIAKGDKTVVRIIWHGTHKGEYQGVPPSGKTIVDYQIGILRVVDNKIHDWWISEDNFGFMQQLGMELKPKEARK